MPISKSLSKVHKHIGGSNASVHPKGRKFKQLNKATIRHERLTREKGKRLTNKQGELVRVRFFQEAVKTSEAETYSYEEMRELVEIFISRDDEELEAEVKARRKGRPKSGKQDALETRIAAERQEFKSGFSIPDLRDAENVKLLANWEGSAGGLTKLKFVDVSSEDSAQEDGDVAM